MGFTTLDGQSPPDGSIAQPIASGRYGMHDSIRQLEAVVIGKAYSFKNSTDPADRLSVYLFGNASARPELGGVIAQDGNAPTMNIAIATGDADCAQGCFAGYAPILLAPGEVVRRGQHLEPIPSGAYQAQWRVSLTGPAKSRQYFDNSAGTEGALISADIFECCDEPGAGESAAGPSDALTLTTAETAYKIGSTAVTRTIEANSLRVGSRLKVVVSVTATTGAAGGNIVKVYINGIGSGVIATSPTVTYANGDVYDMIAEGYISAIGASGSLRLSGFQAFGAPGTATARPVAAALTIDTTVDNLVTVAVTPNNNSDSTTLQFLSVESP